MGPKSSIGPERSKGAEPSKGLVPSRGTASGGASAAHSSGVGHSDSGTSDTGTVEKTQRLQDGRPMKNVAILGATGSVGTATVDVLEHLDRVDGECGWRMWAASGHRNLTGLAKIAASAARPPDRLIASCTESFDTKPFLADPRLSGTEVVCGEQELVRTAEHADVDIVVAAIVGRAGLESTLAAVKAGKRVALANKETLVVAGPIVREACQASGAEVLPVDSEHSALFQCIGDRPGDVEKLILTASGGPFRNWTEAQMEQATVESALQHPTWEMGAKITIDSATMMNKALEIIEARWLFDIPADQIEVVVHPQSMVHSMVEFRDHSILSQFSPPDMRLPIQYALTYPRRLPGVAKRWERGHSDPLELLPPDRDRFPALDLGFEVARCGGSAGAVVNAANEVAVGLFLDRQIRFTDIVPTCRKVLENHDFDGSPSLSELIRLDEWARGDARRACC
ncbi:MAG: 1-deoxy-D-xylulose-5-phosphate reductoisomerase [Planctomycetota bacterium]